MRSGAVLSLLLAALAACEPFATTPRARMARELACTEERTTLRRLEPAAEGGAAARTRLRAHGCGRVATYACAPNDECWREGLVEDDPRGPPPGVALE